MALQGRGERHVSLWPSQNAWQARKRATARAAFHFGRLGTNSGCLPRRLPNRVAGCAHTNHLAIDVNSNGGLCIPHPRATQNRRFIESGSIGRHRASRSQKHLSHAGGQDWPRPAPAECRNSHAGGGRDRWRLQTAREPTDFLPQHRPPQIRHRPTRLKDRLFVVVNAVQ